MGRIKNRESEEMYLETILLLRRKKANVRAVDVCEELGYVKSCVSRGVNLLKAKGYVTIDQATGNIEFTPNGKKRAEGIYERYQVLSAHSYFPFRFFTYIYIIFFQYIKVKIFLSYRQ